LNLVLAKYKKGNVSYNKLENHGMKGQKREFRADMGRTSKKIFHPHPKHLNSEGKSAHTFSASSSFISVLDIEKAFHSVEKSPEEPFKIALSALQSTDHRPIAKKLLKALIQTHPHFLPSYITLGQLLNEEGAYSESLEWGLKALFHDHTQSKDIYLNLAEACEGVFNEFEAFNYFQEAYLIDPNHLTTLLKMAEGYEKRRKLQKAIEFYTKALEQPEGSSCPHIFQKLGHLYANEGNPEKAIDAYQHYLKFHPSDLNTLNHLAILSIRLNQPAQAVTCYEEAYQASGYLCFLIKKALTLPIIYQSNEEISQWRSHQWDTLKHIEKFLSEPSKSKETNPSFSADSKASLCMGLLDPLHEVGCTNFYLAYQGFNDEEHQGLLGKIIQLAYSPSKTLPLLSPPTSSSFNQQKEGRYKIGILSRFLTKDHTITLLYQGLIHQLPRDKFDVVYFTLLEPGASLPPFSMHPNDQLIELSSHSLTDNHALIQAQQLDLLYYLDLGMDPLSYYLAYARLAPVQCTTWGHPSTTGIPTIDYFITQDEIDPLPQSALHYTEKLVHFQHLNIFYSQPKALSTENSSFALRENFGFSKEDRLYICAQSLFKIHPDFDEALKGILEADPKAQILFLEGPNPSWGEALKKRWQKTIPNHDQRIHLLSRVDHQGFIQFQTMADVLLDTFPFAGGNTTLEALGYGIPMVTLNNKLSRGRVSLAIYKQMEIPDCIAENCEEYITLAVKIANDEDFRQQLSQKIKAAHPKIFETQAPVQELTTFFCKAIHQANELSNSLESIKN
jgi:protein O-GlcNAc transferase